MTPLDHIPHQDQHSSATAAVIEGLETFGYTPGRDELDYRPMPEPEELQGCVSAIFAIMADTLHGTCLEPDLEVMLRSLTDVFHRKADNVRRELDDNESNQRRSQDLQDGSEIRSVELENLIMHGQMIMQRRDAFESLRDTAAECFRNITGSFWTPRAGSMANRKAMTAAIIDSRDYINAKRYKETTTLTPPGTLIAISGGVKFNDSALVLEKLDMLYSRFPDMILIHGGAKTGADKIAACWARAKGITEIKFEPDFQRFGDAAGFKRNDEIIKLRPEGILIFDGSGVQHQMAREAKKAGIKINDYRTIKPAEPNR